MSRAWLEREFPFLTHRNFDITSPKDGNYNCIAFAAGESDRNWWPTDLGGYYWPPGVPMEPTVEVFKVAFEQLGYQETTDLTHVPGVEKVALFVKHGKPTHMARQLDDGRWTSKLGTEVDISHREASDVGGEAGRGYGEIELIMKRRRMSDSS